MNKNESKKWVGVAGRMLLSYALVFVQGAWATQDQGTKDKSASPQKAAAQQANEKQSAAATTPIAQNKQAQGEDSESAVAEEKPSRDGSHQGIKVHGHWTIEVKNPDGSLVNHREFENSLIQNNPLSAFLSRTYSVGPWGVVLIGGVCLDSFHNVGVPCRIIEPQTANLGVGIYPFLNTSNSGTSLILSGTLDGSHVFGGSITEVQTFGTACPPATPASSPCLAVSPGSSSVNSITFTDVTLATPIQVSAGQSIAVTVTISFS